MLDIFIPERKFQHCFIAPNTQPNTVNASPYIDLLNVRGESRHTIFSMLKRRIMIHGWHQRFVGVVTWISKAPERIDALEERVAKLEELLGGKYPADLCRSCGEQAMRLRNTIGPDTKGLMRETWQCQKCNFQEDRQVKPR